MLKKENHDKLVIFSLSKTKIICYISTIALFWILSIVFYLLPELEHDILIGFNDLRQPGQIFRDFWYFFTRWFIYIFGFILLGLYLSSFKIEKLKIYRTAMLVSVLLYGLGYLFIGYVLKAIFNRPRPFWDGILDDLYNIYDPDAGASFPSGHTYIGFIMVLPLITALLTNDENFKTSLKNYIISAILLVYATMMGLSRIFVGVHYPSDVIFSVGLAFFLTLFAVYIFSKLLASGKLNNENEKWYSLISIIILIISTVLTLI